MIFYQKRFLLTCLLFFTLSKSAFSQDPITYLSYNILEGLKSDSVLKSDYVTWVSKINPDIVTYQETNKFTQKSLEEFASLYGHPYAVLAKEQGYPVAITSKYAIVNVQKVLDNMWHGYLYANILDYHVFVIHLSPFNQEKRNHEIAQVIAHARLLPPGAKVIISGDFNAVSAADKNQESAEMVAAMRKAESERAQIRNLKNGQIDYGVIQKMTEAGFVDAFNDKNKRFKHSIPTRKYATENSFNRRIDFIFTSANLGSKITHADIIHDTYTDYLSDHYPMLIKLNR